MPLKSETLDNQDSAQNLEALLKEEAWLGLRIQSRAPIPRSYKPSEPGQEGPSLPNKANEALMAYMIIATTLSVPRITPKPLSTGP